MSDFKMFICYQPRKVDDAIDEAIVEHVIPQLRALIDAAAAKVLENPGFEQSPIAKEFAAELIIKGLAGVLALSSFDDAETARRIMLEPKFINWWFGLEDEE
jgi:hypothetical protein